MNQPPGPQKRASSFRGFIKHLIESFQQQQPDDNIDIKYGRVQIGQVQWGEPAAQEKHRNITSL